MHSQSANFGKFKLDSRNLAGTILHDSVHRREDLRAYSDILISPSELIQYSPTTRWRTSRTEGSSRWWSACTSSATWSPLRWPRRTRGRRQGCQRLRPGRGKKLFVSVAGERLTIKNVLLIMCRDSKDISWPFGHRRVRNISHVCKRGRRLCTCVFTCIDKMHYIVIELRSVHRESQNF